MLDTVTSLPAGAIPVDDEEEDLPVVQSLPKGAIPVDAPNKSDPNSPDFEHDFSFINMMANAPGSALGVLTDTYNMVTSPIETGKALYNMGFSGLKDAVLERYGSWEKFQRTLEQDPAGVALDLGFVVSPVAGGARTAATAAGRAAASAGSRTGVKAAQLAQKGASAVEKFGQGLQSADPLNVAYQGAKGVGQGVTKALDLMLGTSTGAGPGSMVAAREAGRTGGEAQKAFMRGQGSIIDDAPNPVEQAKFAKQSISADNSKAYMRDMTPFFESNKAISPRMVVSELRDLYESFRSPSPAGTKVRMPEEIEKLWNKRLGGDVGKKIRRFAGDRQFNLAGVDALRADLDNLRFGKYKEKRQVASLLGKMSKRLREIGEEAHPGYRNVLERYSRAKEIVDELERALSLKARSSTDTAIRKLMQATRKDTSHANFGYRNELVNLLAERQPGLVHELAGQLLSPGLRNAFFTQTAGATGLAGWYTGNWALLGTLLAFSPKVVGKAQNAVGIAQRPFYKAGRAVHKLIADANIGPAGPLPQSRAQKAAKALGDNASTIRRGAQEVAVQPGRAEDAGYAAEDAGYAYDEEQQSKLKALLMSRNKQSGKGIAPSVIDRVVRQLSSTDPQEVEKGLRTLANNERLRSLMSDE